ncbi:Asp-tRNA(Asn)/Glu-tRNA(Gln) amidotransferase subunit GatB [Candidatus Comchoanobacter bicostacola]|uniref:Aspartyl/glutamyl-tRNA(Asn/Gln) amidotransferase subunit B n=1 Tax=Candidatus Comchoanobacter bicostacola TaxID=2919598 RepID=A0ABY5DJP1_9GAMM|nr:Asp-tRNA(Asn)/Glu-tRNA(Gln) amidotransferase subunit GatB [Candidatus Comchoanobacter bicostacola]UTC24144.1 Asp-tRNA(Asn)/Glu-tRNA(Gln) amidotransferase subunit GatB [Candidatus Comchoanobacter bicostacola]
MALDSQNIFLNIGLEIHIQLSTKTKAFSSAPVQYGNQANQNIRIVDVAIPGTLPIVNKEMMKQAIMFGKCVDAQVNQKITFARKHYFYPDLPKGYQITQDENPILVGGSINYELNGKTKQCMLHHAHLEEDAGKSLHGYKKGTSGIDLNRAGQPLLEIVTEPCLESIDDAIAFLKQLHSLVTYLGICDGNMQEGSFRCDVNISVKPSKDAPLGNRVEIKNMNSFKFIQRALQYEIERQVEQINDGQKVHQETRLYNEKKQSTESMRSKENANDYRYFSEPDIPTIWIDEQFIADAISRLPEIPEDRVARYEAAGMQPTDARIIAYQRPMADFADQLIDYGHEIKTIANWILGPISALANKAQIDFASLPISSNDIHDILTKLVNGALSSKMAKEVLEHIWNEQKSVDEIIEKYGLKQLDSEEEIAKIIQDILEKNPNQLAAYRSGKDKLFGYFVGQAMKATQGQANPGKLNKILKEMLSG